jgi:hypothetical protein
MQGNLDKPSINPSLTADLGPRSVLRRRLLTAVAVTFLLGAAILVLQAAGPEARRLMQAEGLFYSDPARP